MTRFQTESNVADDRRLPRLAMEVRLPHGVAFAGDWATVARLCSWDDNLACTLVYLNAVGAPITFVDELDNASAVPGVWLRQCVRFVRRRLPLMLDTEPIVRASANGKSVGVQSLEDAVAFLREYNFDAEADLDAIVARHLSPLALKEQLLTQLRPAALAHVWLRPLTSTPCWLPPDLCWPKNVTIAKEKQDEARQLARTLLQDEEDEVLTDAQLAEQTLKLAQPLLDQLERLITRSAHQSPSDSQSFLLDSKFRSVDALAFALLTPIRGKLGHVLSMYWSHVAKHVSRLNPQDFVNFESDPDNDKSGAVSNEDSKKNVLSRLTTFLFTSSEMRSRLLWMLFCMTVLLGYANWRNLPRALLRRRRPPRLR